nr:hypothetical protein [uncultured Bdellovibrio sp.]
MKKLLVMAAMTVAATNAFAGVKLVVRSDYVNTPNYDDNTGAEVAGTSVFTPAVARLYLTGMVGDAVIDSGWNLRAFTLDFNGAGTSATKTMTVDQFVDHLTIAKPMGDWTFTAGKLQTNVGGYEHGKTIMGDTYLTSLAGGGVGGDSQVGSVVIPGNSSGVAAAYAINADHKLEFQVTNQSNAQTLVGGEKSTDKRHNMGLAYWGSFAEKMFQTYISYTIGAGDTINMGTGVTTGHELTYLAAGFRIAPMENLNLDLEYLANTDKNATTSDKNETNSTIVEASYKINNWTPMLKYEMSNDKVAGNDNFKRNAFAVGVEYMPKAEDAFRYHIAYASAKDDFDNAALEDVTFNTITVGFKYTGDIAK